MSRQSAAPRLAACSTAGHDMTQSSAEEQHTAVQNESAWLWKRRQTLRTRHVQEKWFSHHSSLTTVLSPQFSHHHESSKTTAHASETRRESDDRLNEANQTRSSNPYRATLRTHGVAAPTLLPWLNTLSIVMPPVRMPDALMGRLMLRPCGLSTRVSWLARTKECGAGRALLPDRPAAAAVAPPTAPCC